MHLAARYYVVPVTLRSICTQFKKSNGQLAANDFSIFHSVNYLLFGPTFQTPLFVALAPPLLRIYITALSLYRKIHSTRKPPNPTRPNFI